MLTTLRTNPASFRCCLVAIALSLLGCGSSVQPPATSSGDAPPPSDVPTASDNPGPSNAPADTGSAESPAAPSQPPSATVKEVLPSNESVSYARVKIEFKNPNSTPCKLTQYKLSWDKFSKTIPLENFTIPEGQSRERSIRIHPGDGDLKSLTVENARVELQSACGQ